MEGIDLLRERITALLKRYGAAVRECKALEKELAAREQESAALRVRLEEAEQQLLAVRIGKAIPDKASRAQSRKKLDAVIGEIDKILITLND